MSIEPLPSNDFLSAIAKTWGLSNLVFVRKMENIVYSADSDAGKVYLRLTTPLRRARGEIEAEIRWIEHLGKCGLKVPEVIADRKGQRIASFTKGNQHYEAVVFSAIEGEHPSIEMATSAKFLKTLGALIAKMHEASQNYDHLHHQIKREEWFEERGIRHALAAAPSSKETTLCRRFNEIIEWMQALPRTAKTYGLIHADLGVTNLFIEQDASISVIDFDDSCYHWFVFDLAYVLASTSLKCSRSDGAIWQEWLLEGYRTVRPLSQEEIDWIPRLITFIYLRLFFWIEHHESLNTFHDSQLKHIADLKQQILQRLLNY